MKIFGFGKDKSVPKMDKLDTSDSKKLADSEPKLQKIVDSNTINYELFNRPAVDLIGDKWPRQSLFHGTAYGVEWKPNKKTIDDYSELDVAVGINQEEALGALISSEVAENNNLLEEEQTELEEYFVGFIHDLLGEMETPDGKYKLDQEVHRQMFHTVDSGVIFDYIKPEQQKNPFNKKVATSEYKSIIEKSPSKSIIDKFDHSQAKRSLFADYYGPNTVSVPKIHSKENPKSVSKKELPVVDIPDVKVTAYAAPRYYETKDPVLLISTTTRSTAPIEEGYYDDEGLTKVRTAEAVVRNVGTKTQLTNPISKHRPWIPSEVDLLLKETLYFSGYVNIPERENTGTSDIYSPQSIFTAYLKGEYYNHDSDDNDWPSPIALNRWRQAWLPIMLDVEFEYYREENNWELKDIDYERTSGNEKISDTASEPTTIKYRIPLSRNSNKIVSTQIRRFLDEEDQLDEDGKGVLSNGENGEYLMFLELMNEFKERELLSASLSGIDDYINSIEFDSAIRAGLVKITKMNVIDAFGQITTVDGDGLFYSNDGQSPRITVGLSLQNDNDEHGKLVLRPRIPRPSRLDFRLLSYDDDTLPAISSPSSVSMNKGAFSPVCGYLLPDHIEWAMEIFDPEGSAKGQLRVAERDWSLGGIQKGKLVWDSSPGEGAPVGELPNTGNIHLDRMLNQLMEIGLTDEIEKASNIEGGEGALSALLRAIDTTYWHMDPFAKGGINHPTFYMGRPVAMIRAVIRLQLEGGENNMSEELKNHHFQVKLGCIEKEIDGLLGYFVNDDYSRFNAVYPLDQDRNPEHPSTGSLDHDYLVFDPTLELKAEQDIYLTLLVNPQASFHITSGILPQKEITLIREHWEDAVSRIAPTFKIGPVLVDPSSIRMPIDDVKPNLSWRWVHRETPSDWVETEIKRSDSLAGLPNDKMKAYEGWIKLDIIED